MHIKLMADIRVWHSLTKTDLYIEKDVITRVMDNKLVVFGCSRTARQTKMLKGFDWGFLHTLLHPISDGTSTIIRKTRSDCARIGIFLCVSYSALVCLHRTVQRCFCLVYFGSCNSFERMNTKTFRNAVTGTKWKICFAEGSGLPWLIVKE